jgi:glucose/arabinose dehydrogenase
MLMNLRCAPHLTLLLLVAAALLAACGDGAPQPTPTAAPPPALLGANLLAAPAVQIACDTGEGAQIHCAHATDGARMTVSTNASTFARWALQFDTGGVSLTGNETLALRARRTGALTPNLYLVEQDGDRMSLPLTRYGLGDDWATLHIPLREVKDDSGARPDFATVRELQVVFEWSDQAGVFEIGALQFDPIWQEPVTVASASGELATALRLPAGFTATAVADNLREMTQIKFTPQGDMLVSLQNGRVWRYFDDSGDGVYDRRQLYDAGYVELVGLLHDPQDGAVWLGGRGQLIHTLDSNGDGAADVREVRIDGLPWGRHQNNGLTWNPDPDPFSGEPGGTWLYFGLGSTEDLEVGGDLNATVLRFPRSGQGQGDLEVVSRGNRNAYDVLFAPAPVDLAAPDGPTAWQLFASENGPDFNDAPDEVNHIRWGLDYGFPAQFGMVEDAAAEGVPYSSPVYPVTPHASANGLAYISNPAWPAAYRTLYVTLFGEVFSSQPVGHIVERITLTTTVAADGVTYRGEPSEFIGGLDRPLPLVTAPDGNLLVGDYATGVVYRIGYAGEE